MTTETPPQELSEASSAQDVFAHFSKQNPDPHVAPVEQPPQQQAKPAEPAPAKTEPASTKAEQKGVEIPDSILGIKKQEDPDDFDSIIKEAPKGQIKHEDFKRVKDAAERRVNAQKAELDQLRTELEKHKGKTAPDEFVAELERYKTKAAEYEAALERQAVRDSPKFKQQFTDKETAIAERLKRTATEMGLDNDTIQNALNSSLKRRSELLEALEMPSSVRGAIDHLMVQHDLLQDEKGKFLETASETHRQWQAEQKLAMEAQDKERTAYESKLFNDAVEKLSKTFTPLQKVEGNDAWNASVDERIAKARLAWEGKLDASTVAEVPIVAAGAEILIEINRRQHEKLQEMAAELAALKLAQPNANGSGAKVDTRQGTAKPGTTEAYMETFNRAQAGTLDVANSGFGNGQRL